MINLFLKNGKYAIFEDNGIGLDGSYNVIEENEEEGWFSDKISDINGNLNVQYSQNVFNDKEQESDLHILFTNIRNEYAVNFDVIIRRKNL